MNSSASAQIASMFNLDLNNSPHVHRNSIGSKPGSNKQLGSNAAGSRPNSTTRMSGKGKQQLELNESHRIPDLTIKGLAKTGATTQPKNSSSSNSSKHSRHVSSASTASRQPAKTKLKNVLQEKSSEGSVTSTTVSTAGTASDKENRDEPPIYLDEMSHLLLEELHHDNPKVVLRALERLSQFCSESSDLCSQACHMGAPASMVNLMKHWALHKGMQAKCFRALIAMIVGSGNNKEEQNVRKTLWMVGCVQEVLKSMTRFPESRSVQFFGCNALLSLLPCGGGGSENPGQREQQETQLKQWMGRRFVRDYRGVKVVIAGMITFEEDRVIQEAGCSVLLKLATVLHGNRQDRKMLLESGAVSAFSVALESHSNDDEIQHYTTMFMNFMSSGAGDMY